MMAMRFLTLTDIRAMSGLTVDQISDVDLTNMGEDAEWDTERELNTVFTPRTVIEVFEGDGSNRLVNLKNPLLKVRSLKIDSTSVSPSTLRLEHLSGNVWLTNASEYTYFRSNSNERNLVRVKYDYGFLEADSVQTLTTSVTTLGDSITVSVSSSTGIEAGDYVQLSGMDSNVETVKVSSVPGPTSIVVDNLVQNHESGSLVTLQKVPNTAVSLMAINASTKALVNVIAGKVTGIQSYSIGEESVTNVDILGSLNATLSSLVAQKIQIFSSIRIRPAVM